MFGSVFHTFFLEWVPKSEKDAHSQGQMVERTHSGVLSHDKMQTNFNKCRVRLENCGRGKWTRIYRAPFWSTDHSFNPPTQPAMQGANCSSGAVQWFLSEALTRKLRSPTHIQATMSPLPEAIWGSVFCSKTLRLDWGELGIKLRLSDH